MHSVPQLPLDLDYYLFSLIIQPESFFALTAFMGNRLLDAFYFHVLVSLGFMLYLVWYLFTSIPTLIANVSIHRMISVYLLASFFQFDILLLFYH